MERRLFELHDPFPSTSAGPDTQARPRGFDVPRSEPRQAIEGQVLQGLQQQPAPALPPPNQTYPQTVPQ